MLLSTRTLSWGKKASPWTICVRTRPRLGHIQQIMLGSITRTRPRDCIAYMARCREVALSTYAHSTVPHVCGTDFLPKDVVAWCDRCVHPQTGSVDTLAAFSQTHMSVMSMRLFDWVMLCFSFFIVALTACGELKDVRLCICAIREARQKLNPAVRFMLISIQVARRWVFLQAMLMSMPIIVTFLGAGSLKVAFNTVAVLFM
jgi:hypothetical protein